MFERNASVSTFSNFPHLTTTRQGAYGAGSSPNRLRTAPGYSESPRARETLRYDSSMQSQILLSLLVALLSAAATAYLTHRFNRSRKREDELAEFRLRAYADFLAATSKLSTARRLGESAEEADESLLIPINDAKARICICATEPVLEELRAFVKAGATLETEPEIIAYTRLCNAMRVSLGVPRNQSSAAEMSDILWTLEASRYSYRGAKKRQKSASDEDTSG